MPKIMNSGPEIGKILVWKKRAISLTHLKDYNDWYCHKGYYTRILRDSHSNKTSVRELQVRLSVRDVSIPLKPAF